MAKILFHIGKRLMVSNRHRSVRQGLIWFFTNLLLISGVIFTFEIILILLGVGNVFIPLTHRAADILAGLVF